MIVEFDKELFNEMLLKLKELIEVVRARRIEDTFNEVMTTKEAAAYLKASPRTLQELRNSGKVRFSQDGQLVRYRKVDMEAYLKEYQVGKNTI